LPKSYPGYLDGHSGETNYTPDIRYQDDRLQLYFTDHRAYFLKPGLLIKSDPQRIELVSGDVPTALLRYQAHCRQAYPLDPLTPDWVRDMVLLEIYPLYYDEGFTEITERLPFTGKLALLPFI
ncbi:MAG: hypothetical protein HC880_05510, partial [Bacteroidia bacterium]|nr:hypothetical protein [Bacteroidia bacterium]